MTPPRHGAGGERGAQPPPAAATTAGDGAARPLAWSAIDLATRHLFQFLVSLVLARLLAPEDFGTIALLNAVVAVLGMFVDAGLSTALIQRQRLEAADASTVFWIQSACGLAAAAMMWFGLPGFATLVGVPELDALRGIGAAIVVANSLGAVHVTLLTRALDFLTQFKAGTTAALASAGVAVPLAVHGYGVWALAAQAASFSIVFTLMLWWLHPWRPARAWNGASAASLLRFGGFILAANLSNAVFERASSVLIGRLHGVRALGYFHRAETTQQLPAGLLGAILARTLLPLLAREAADPVRLRALTSGAIRGAMLLNAPMILGLAAVAAPALEAFFGARWLPATVLLQVLCVAGLLWPMHLINLNVLVAQGHARTMLRVEIFKKAIGLAMLLLGARYGVIGIASALAAFSVLGLAINTHYTGRLLRYGLWAQLRDVAPVLAIASTMAIAIGVIERRWHAPPALELAVLVAGGAVLFLAQAALFRLRALAEARSLLLRSGAS